MELNMVDRLTARELVLRSDPKKGKIIEALTMTNNVFSKLPMIQANDGTVHTQLVRTSLPHSTRRNYNEGVKAAASTTTPFKDIIQTNSVYSVVDKNLADDSGNKEQFISDENVAFVSGMGQDMASDIIYADNKTDASASNGFACRRTKVDDKYTFDMGASGSNLTSLYLVAGGKGFTSLIYPKGSFSAALTHENRGVQDWDDGKGGKFPAYINYFEARFGVAVGDQRSLLRLANIDPKNTDPKDLIEQILKMSYKLPKGIANYYLFCNADVMWMLDKAAQDRLAPVASHEDPWGNPIYKIRDLRIYQEDSILSTENQVKKINS